MKRGHAERVPQYLQHILDAIDRACSYVAGMDLASFERDSRTQDAVIRSIEIVGEAANKTRNADPDFAARHPQVPWDAMYGMRNRIVHDYFEVESMLPTCSSGTPFRAFESKRSPDKAQRF